MITVTENAAKQIVKIRDAESSSDKSLRIAVEGGGCSGNRYKMGFDSPTDNDEKFESQGLSLVVDQQSLALLNGVELDFVESMEGSSFVFNNPNATGGCGCGKSFS